MPKSIHKIGSFSGGLDLLNDPRDIEDDAFVEGYNTMTDLEGKLRMMGGDVVHPSFSTSITEAKIDKGAGLFVLHTDHNFIPTVELLSITSRGAINDSGKYPYVLKTDTSHNLAVGDKIEIFDTTHLDGHYIVQSGTLDADEFTIWADNNTSAASDDAHVVDGYLTCGDGDFTSLVMSNHGAVTIYGPNNKLHTNMLTLGAGSYNHKTSSVSSVYHPQRWDWSKLGYWYQDGILRVYNKNYHYKTNLTGGAEAQLLSDHPTSYIYKPKTTWFPGCGSQEVAWKKGWYEAPGYIQSPRDWGMYRKFRHADAIDKDDFGQYGRHAIYMSDGAVDKTDANFKALTDAQLGTNLAPGSIFIRPRVLSSGNTAGEWSTNTSYKLGISYCYDRNLDDSYPQDSEVQEMHRFTEGSGNISTYADDGAIIIPSLDGEPIGISLQLYLKSGGNDFFGGADKWTSSTAQVTPHFWSPRMTGFRIWEIGTVTGSNADAVVSNYDSPYLVLEADFEKGVRAYAKSEWAPWSSYEMTDSGFDSAPYDDGHWDQEIVTHEEFLLLERPPYTYQDINEMGANDRFLNLKYKTQTVLNGRNYVGNFEANTKTVSTKFPGINYPAHYPELGFTTDVDDDTEETDPHRMIRYPDKICRSELWRWDSFNPYGVIEVGDQNDGQQITYMDSIGQMLLVWKDDSLHVYDTSNDLEQLISSHPFMGVDGEGQVCKVDTGIAWVNKNGVWYIDSKEGSAPGSLTEGKIDAITWASFYADGATIGFIPEDKQIVVIEQGNYGYPSTIGDCFVFSLLTSSWNRGWNRTQEFPKSNALSSYDDSLIYASPGHDVNEIFTTNIIQVPEYATYGVWRITEIPSMVTDGFVDSKLTIGTTDITNVFTYHGPNAPEYIKTKIIEKTGTVFIISTTPSSVEILFNPLGATSTYSVANMQGVLSITNPPNPTLTYTNAEFSSQHCAFYPTTETWNGETIPEGDYFFGSRDGYESVTGQSPTYKKPIATSTGSVETQPSALLPPPPTSLRQKGSNSPIPIGLLLAFGKFTIAEADSSLGGGTALNASNEGTFSVTYDNGGLGTGYDPDTEIVYHEGYQGVFTSNTSMVEELNVPAKVTIPKVRFFNHNNDDNYGRFIILGDYEGVQIPVGTSITVGSSQSNNGTCKVIERNMVFVGQHNYAYVEYKVHTRQEDASLTMEPTTNEVFTPSSCAVTFSATSGQMMQTHNIQLPEGGLPVNIDCVPNRQQNSGFPADKEYNLLIDANDGSAHTIKYTTSANDGAKHISTALVSDYGALNVANESNLFHSISKPSFTHNVDLNATHNTIINEGNTWRDFPHLFTPGTEITLTNCANASNNGDYVIDEFTETGNESNGNKAGGTKDCIVVATSSVPSAYETGIAGTSDNDEVTMTCHAVRFIEKSYAEWPLRTTAGVFHGLNIYKFKNNIDNTAGPGIFRWVSKDVDLGAPGIHKNILKVLITARYAENIMPFFFTNGDTSMELPLVSTNSNKAYIDVSNATWHTHEFVPEVRRSATNIFSFMLGLRNKDDNSMVSGIEINDISIIYRAKGAK